MHRECVTVIFVDIEDFTGISELISSKAMVSFLAEFFDLTTGCIRACEGTIDKYIGDCCMAFFNAPKRVSDHATKAVRAAHRIVSVVAQRNRDIVDRTPFKVRCGINTGESLVGLIGSSERYSYTVMGDTVNVASRLEALNKRYGTRIMVGPQTVVSAKREFLCQYVDTVCLKGKVASVAVHVVLGKHERVSSRQMRD